MNFLLNRWFLCILFVVLSIQAVGAQDKTTTGNKKLFDKIVRKMEDNLEKNYFIDSVQPVQYSQYTYVDSSKHLLNAVYIEGINRPVWFADYSYYKQKYKANLLSPVYFWTAEFYEENAGQRYGTMGAEEPFGYMLFVLEMQNSLAQHLSAKAERRRESAAQHNTDYNRSKMGNLSYTIDNRICQLAIKEDFQVIDTIYEGRACYMLVSAYERQSFCGETEKKRYEEILESQQQDEDKKKELRRLINLWGNARYTGKTARVIAKDDYALLYVFAEDFAENSSGKILTNRMENKFTKTDKKYKPLFYKTCSRRLNAGSDYFNGDDIYTFLISRPLSGAPPVAEAQSYTHRVTVPPSGYEDFCNRISAPTERMLKEWRIFIQE